MSTYQYLQRAQAIRRMHHHGADPSGLCATFALPMSRMLVIMGGGL